MTHTLTLDEGDRQMLLLALAVLSLVSPGFHFALNQIALKVDTPDALGRAELFEKFRELRRDTIPEGTR